MVHLNITTHLQETLKYNKIAITPDNVEKRFCCILFLNDTS